MSANKGNGTSKTSLFILIGYLISSIFAGLIFSGLALRAKSHGGSGIGWGILSIICIGLFGFMGFAFIKTSSTSLDAFYYYLGIITLISNALAALILVLTFFKRT
jgi:hypothetical protein